MKSQSKTLRLVSLLSVLALTALATTAVKAQSIEVGTQLRHVSYQNTPQVVVSGPNYQVTYAAPAPVTRVVYQTVAPVVHPPVRVYDGRYEHRRHHQYNRHVAPGYYQPPVRYVPAPHYVPVNYVAPAPVIVKPAPIYHHHRPHWDNRGW